jgi:hypothetical protein
MMVYPVVEETSPSPRRAPHAASPSPSHFLLPPQPWPWPTSPLHNPCHGGGGGLCRGVGGGIGLRTAAAAAAFASNEFGYTALESEELNETEPPPRDSGEDDPDAAAFLLDSAAAEVKATEAGLALAEVAADWLLGWAGGGLGGGATEAAREASVAALLGVPLSKRRR